MCKIIRKLISAFVLSVFTIISTLTFAAPVSSEPLLFAALLTNSGGETVTDIYDANFVNAAAKVTNISGTKREVTVTISMYIGARLVKFARTQNTVSEMSARSYTAQFPLPRDKTGVKIKAEVREGSRVLWEVELN